MQEYEVAFEVAVPPHRVWRLLHPRVAPDAAVPRTIEHPGGSITILRDGDEAGEGLVRTCTFPSLGGCSPGASPGPGRS